MKTGISKVCITPPVGIDLTGYGARKQPSVGVHDDLYVRGLYLEEGGEKLLWLHCDLLSLERDRVLPLRSALVAELDLEERQVVMSATHTHAGPATQRLRGCGEIDPAYLDELDRHLLDAARQAAASPEEATLWFAEGRCDLAIDRRRTPSAHVDPTIPYLAFKRPDGTVIALVTNYAIHNVAMTSVNRLVSAEMAGVAARHVSEQLSGRPVVLFSNGACGNVNPPGSSDDFSAPEKFGADLGAALTDLIPKANPCERPVLSSRMETVRVPLLVQGAAQVEQEYQRTLTKWPNPWTKMVMTQWRDETLDLISRGKAPTHVESELQVFRIGPASFAAMGAEVFSRMADDLRALRGKHTYVVGYANGNLGYLPFREAYEEGGYEVEYAYKLYMSFNVAPSSFDLLRDRAVALLEGLQ